MGKRTAKAGKDGSHTLTRATANIKGGKGPGGTVTLVKGGGGGGSGARGKRQQAKARGKNTTRKAHPVDTVFGQVVDEIVELSLPGPIPIVWKRLYASGFNDETTPLGRGGWTHELHQWVGIDGDELVLRGEDGRNLALPNVEPGGVGFHRGARLDIRRSASGDAYELESIETFLTRVFEPVIPGGAAMLREIRDRWGNRVQLAYANGLLVSVRAFGRELRLTHDAKGRILRVAAWAEGAERQSIAYAYTREGELARATDALGHHDAYAYDGLHRLTKITLKNGVSFYYEYDDELERCVKTWGDGDIHRVEFVYDLVARTTVTADLEPRRITWNERGALLREETPDGDFAKEYVYDDDLLALAEKNAAGETISYEYDARGNLIALTDPAGNVTRWEYVDDLPVRRVGPDGLVTEYAHDRRGALIELRHPTGVRFQLTYTGSGQLAAVFGVEGTLVSFEYDAQGNIVREADARGASTRFAYDPLGRPTTRADALARVTGVEYDALGRPLAIQRPDGTTVKMAYDALGNVVRTTDPMGLVTRMEYAGTGVLVKQVLPDGREWRFAYDSAERLVQVQNPKCERYEYRYNRAGRIREETTFDGRVLRYAYSRADRLTRIEKPDGTYREFLHDPLGNIVQENSPHGPQKYARDTLGRLLQATVIEHSGKTIVDFERDAFGRIIAESQNGQRILFEYDAFGRRTVRVLPSGETTRYSYDVAGALAGVDQDGYTIAVQRDVVGRETRRHLRSGEVNVFSSYDVLDRLVDQWATAPTPTGEAAQSVLTQRKWTYDPNGRVTSIHDGRWGVTQYRYDELGQLIEARRNEHREVFEYNAAGALDAALGELGLQRWRIEEGSLLIETPDARFEYDESRRRKKVVHRKDGHETGEVTEYLWDCRDRLREVRLPSGQRALYTYDAFGRRVRKDIVPPDHGDHTVPERVRVVQFLWDGSALAREVDTESGKRVFVHEPGTLAPLLQQERGEIFAYLNDHLGTPKDLLNADGKVIWSAAHSAWGSVTTAWSKPGSEVTSPFRLLGQYWDDETGLACTQFRYFDHAHAAWLSPDPLGLDGGDNLFAFDGTPTIDSDPLGLCVTKPPHAPPFDSPKVARVIQHRDGSVTYKFKAGFNVTYNKRGFPEFAPHALRRDGEPVSVRIRYTGDRDRDFAAAWKEAGINKRELSAPYTWHHKEDVRVTESGTFGTLLLVRTDVHDTAKHRGGVSIHRERGGLGYDN